MFRMNKTKVGMGDGRNVTYYDYAPIPDTPPYLQIHQKSAAECAPGGRRALNQPPELRWNPTLAEWSAYAPFRMARPMLPSADACPLCPGVLELPLPYQVAIFENRAPALSYVPGAGQAPDASDQFTLSAPANGHCDMVVYSQEHNSRLASMPVNDVYGLVEAWRDRYRELLDYPEVRSVAIVENKGREAGMTLDHPHGQIYALPFVPPILRRQWDQTRVWAGREGLWEQVISRELNDEARVVAQTPGFLAAIPFFARYPYEVHIWARRPGVNSLLEMTPDERRQLAGMLKNITSRYDHVFAEDDKYGFPTLMIMQQLSKVEGCEEFRFHIEFYPLQRSPDKLKYRASIESGTGTFLNDALPETQAAILRGLEPHQVESDTLFED